MDDHPTTPPVRRRLGTLTRTSIRWTDYTWPFASGCYHAGPECRFCYAESMAENAYFARAFPNGFDLTLRPRNLEAPLHRKVPSLIFGGSITDIGLPEIPLDYFAAIMDVVRRARWHVFQLLTKRAAEVRRKLAALGIELPPNVWMGTTIGHRSRLSEIEELLAIPGAGVYWLSIEPLLSDLVQEGLYDHLRRAAHVHGRAIGWVVVGGESGSHFSWPEQMRRATRPGHELAGVERAIKNGPAWVKWWQREHGAPPIPGDSARIRRVADDIEDRFLVRRTGLHRTGPYLLPTSAAIDRVIAALKLFRELDVPFFFKQWGGPEPDSAGHLICGQAYDAMPEHALPSGWRERHEAARKAEAARRSLPVLS